MQKVEVTFKYKGKLITTPNLEKKLKRMKITLEDIEIVEKEEKPKKLIKELRHLLNCYEVSYENYGQFYFDTKEEIPKDVNGHSLIQIKSFEEWSTEYSE